MDFENDDDDYFEVAYFNNWSAWYTTNGFVYLGSTREIESTSDIGGTAEKQTTTVGEKRRKKGK